MDRIIEFMTQFTAYAEPIIDFIERYKWYFIGGIAVLILYILTLLLGINIQELI